ncbi:hypothetical protein [Streptomyces sp. NPDC000410]|uniref:hypothetical protein n=1 Tax=Streptomyces sp. NPDC000410 TaxID=3154254 RepID=UPI003329769C
MGKALATAFLKAGHPTTVRNRTPAKGQDLVGPASGCRPHRRRRHPGEPIDRHRPGRRARLTSPVRQSTDLGVGPGAPRHVKLTSSPAAAF